MCLENRREKVGRRMVMFESMIESILTYGADIWGWKEQEEVEKVQEKYLRGVLGVDRETPSYMEGEQEEIPEYLVRDSAKERKMMARFRCGNEKRENRRETIEHMAHVERIAKSERKRETNGEKY
ncbi:hypothetical protein MTP99_012429 [Tenebrio molitor]|nr:hypothetical protein MTP99_012429 [Tenebrio molitor]